MLEDLKLRRRLKCYENYETFHKTGHSPYFPLCTSIKWFEFKQIHIVLFGPIMFHAAFPAQNKRLNSRISMLFHDCASLCATFVEF